MAQRGAWPRGLGFHPTDDEIMQYLERKRRDHRYVEEYIPEISINEHEPWNIFESLTSGSDDQECHFFSPRKFKHSGSSRSTLVDRTTNSGFWKATGRKRNTTHGMKQVFVFRMGRPNNERRTGWVIHEYEHKDMKKYVLCRLHQKAEEDSYHLGGSSSNASSSPRNQVNTGHQENEEPSYFPDYHQASYMNFQSPGGFAYGGQEGGMDFYNYNSYGHNNYSFDETSDVTNYFNGSYNS